MGRGAPPALLHDLRVAEENAVVQGVTDPLHLGALYDDDVVEVIIEDDTDNLDD